MEHIYMLWNDQSENFLKILERVASCKNQRFLLHVFVLKNSTSVPRGKPWIEIHESLTSEDDAAKVSLVVYILQKYGEKKRISNRRSPRRRTIYLVQNGNEDHEELAALLRSSSSSDVEVKLIISESNNRGLTAKSDPQNSRAQRRCKYCNVTIHDGIDKAEIEPSNGKQKELFSYQERRCDDQHAFNVASSSCAVCGKPRQDSKENAKGIGAMDDVNIKGARHFGNRESNAYGYRQGISKGVNGNIAEIDNNDSNVIGDRELFTDGASVGSSCNFCGCFQSKFDSDVVGEGHFCKRNDPKGILPSKHGRSKSSEGNETEKITIGKCSCSRDGTKICFPCLISKLGSQPPEFKLGRSGSAPTIFFHGDFKKSNGSMRIDSSENKLTKEIAVNTEFMDFAVQREVTKLKPSFAEKSTNTVDEKSTNMVFEKSTCTDDLEVNTSVAEIVEEMPSKEGTDFNSFEMPVGKKSEYSCLFCRAKTYRSKQLLEVHMRNNHKKCNCPCQQYFKTREDYLAHFYFVYPLPCLKDKKCPERFRSLYYQALHHKETHYAAKPFFCIPCHRINGEKGVSQTTFKDVASLRIHATSYGHDPQEMFLVNNDDKADDNRLPFSMRCSGINYC